MGINKKKMATMAAATAAFISSVLPVGAAQAAECLKGEKCYEEDYVATYSYKDNGNYKEKGFYDRYLYNYVDPKASSLSYRDRGWDRKYYSSKSMKG
ncbi:hypothetical protein ACFL21_02915 [Patescibacteria group bacterium]